MDLRLFLVLSLVKLISSGCPPSITPRRSYDLIAKSYIDPSYKDNEESLYKQPERVSLEEHFAKAKGIYEPVPAYQGQPTVYPANSYEYHAIPIAHIYTQNVDQPQVPKQEALYNPHAFSYHPIYPCPNEKATIPAPIPTTTPYSVDYLKMSKQEEQYSPQYNPHTFFYHPHYQQAPTSPTYPCSNGKAPIPTVYDYKPESIN